MTLLTLNTGRVIVSGQYVQEVGSIYYFYKGTIPDSKHHLDPDSNFWEKKNQISACTNVNLFVEEFLLNFFVDLFQIKFFLWVSEFSRKKILNVKSLASWNKLPACHSTYEKYCR